LQDDLGANELKEAQAEEQQAKTGNVRIQHDVDRKATAHCAAAGQPVARAKLLFSPGA
jgi:hypothetical protein